MAIVFMAYSHADEKLRNELEKHLASLRREEVISTWHDRRIMPGEEIDSQISTQLNEAKIIILLVSADFLASDYCYNIEMTRAMERHEEGAAHVIPVILRPCDWQDAPFGKLKAVPEDGKPVIKCASLDEGFLEVVRAVRQAIEPSSSHPTKPEPTTPPTTANLSAQTTPRSDNLKIKKDFNNHDYYTFLNEGFEYIAQYFKNSLNELQARNSNVSSEFKRIDVSHLEARVFVGGQEGSVCSIWIDKKDEYEIFFFNDVMGNGKSYHEVLAVVDDGYKLAFDSTMLDPLESLPDRTLSYEGASEYLWLLFIKILQ